VVAVAACLAASLGAGADMAGPVRSPGPAYVGVATPGGVDHSACTATSCGAVCYDVLTLRSFALTTVPGAALLLRAVDVHQGEVVALADAEGRAAVEVVQPDSCPAFAVDAARLQAPAPYVVAVD
jgi:hypothetical protein